MAGIVTNSNSALPSAMQNKLQSIRRRRIGVVVLRSGALAVATLLVAMILAMGIDWCLTLYSTSVRSVLTTSTLALSAAVLVATGLRPFLTACGSKHAASSADAVVPQLEERWTTVVSFAASDRKPLDSTSRAMLEQVTAEAIALGRLVRPAQVARPATVRPAMLMLLGSIVLMGGFLATNWIQTSVLLRRFFSPATNITATQVWSLSGDQQVPRGNNVRLRFEQTGLRRDTAVLEITTSDGPTKIVEIHNNQSHPASFQYAMAAEQSFQYRVLTGDGRSEWHSIRVIDYPELAAVQLTVTAPEYVDRPKYEKTLIPGRVRVVQGSNLELRLKPVETLQRLDLLLTAITADDESEPVERILEVTSDTDGWYVFKTQVVEDFTFSPLLLSPQGLTNEDPRVCHIQVVEDKSPVARIISPTDEMAVAVDDLVDVKFEAHDDHGIASAELVVYDESRVDRNGEPLVLLAQDIPLGDQTLQKHVMASVQLDLKELRLSEGASISYSVRVKDNRDLTIEPESRVAQMGEARVRPADTKDDSDATGNASEQLADARDVQNRMDASADRTPGESTGRNVTQGELDRSDARQMLSAAAARDSVDTSREGETTPDHEPGGGHGDKDTQVTASDHGQNQETATVKPAAGQDPSTSTADNNSDQPATADQTVSNDETVAGGNLPIKVATGEKKTEPVAGTASDRDREAQDSVAGAASNRKPANRKPAGDDGGSSDTRPGDAPLKDGDTQKTVGNSAEPRQTAENEDKQGTTESDNRPMPEADSSTRPDDSDTDHNGAGSGNQTQPPNENQNGNSSPVEVAAANRDPGDAGNIAPEPSENQNSQQSDNGGTTQPSGQQPRPGENPESGAPRDRTLRMMAQQGAEQQNAETGRRRLRITERLLAVAEARDRRAENMQIRDRVVEIDRRLKLIEDLLARLVERNVADADRADAFRMLDEQLGDTETCIAELRNETKEHQFAFVGLQMVHIGTTHVTPARDHVFIAIREPLGTDNPSQALHHISRAREMLDALLRRYDRVAQDEELAQTIDESVKMYEVYVEKMQNLMREAQQNQNPLRRQMAVIEVNQEYLDRYAEVLRLRREMMTEFGRMLGDDPRLLARYLELVRRRRDSLRDQLSELAERQDETASELSGWLQVGDAQREELWAIVAEFRLHTTGDLAKEADQLLERVEQTMPLKLATDEGSSAQAIELARSVSKLAREIALDGKRTLKSLGNPDSSIALVGNAENMRNDLIELDASLEQLGFDNEDDPEVTAYVQARLLESRTVSDRADAWAQVAGFIEQHAYHGLAGIDQQRLSLATELLRMDMQEIETELSGQFQQVADSEIPGEIVDMIRELHRVMEAITFNQQSASFAMVQDRLEDAEAQQILALENFERAEKLFDQMRRAVVAALDTYDVQDPDIANLRDPTLDEFLAQLEREPNIESQLGIPGRPRNLRVLADAMQWQQTGGDLLGQSSNQARMRAQRSMQMQEQNVAAAGGKPKEAAPEKPVDEMTDEEREELERARQMQETLEKSLASIEEKLKDEQTTQLQKEKLEQMAAQMRRMMDSNGDRHSPSNQWKQIIESDKAKELLAALAAGESLPDDQWNKLLSTLDDGLWQVRGRTPSEDYRKSIEQYQERLRKLMTTTGSGAE